MTDEEVLIKYRLDQAEETISDAEKMLEAGVSPRSVINRAYYSMFYAVLALLLKGGIEVKTSKHAGVISLFDKEFVLTGKIDPKFSKALHRMFLARQEVDYKELVEFSIGDAEEAVHQAKEFVIALRDLIEN